MSRPHTLFIQSQALPWRKGLYGGGRPKVKSKILSIDRKSGDSTCIISYPANYYATTREFTRAHEEFLVLHGMIEINNVKYGQHSYAFLPAGYPRKSVISTKGAVLLTTFSALPRVEIGMPDRGLLDESLLIEKIDTLKLEWDPTLVDPQLSPGVQIKPLRTDPYTGETSFLYTSAAHRIPPQGRKPRWTHPMVEEIYVIDGEYVFSDVGIMGPGAYVWWRENIYHGPSGSIAGFNLWVRTVNGPMTNLFEKKKYVMNWEPEYRPKLPKELKKHARPYRRRKNY